MRNKLARYDEFVNGRVDESLKDWIIAGALAATSFKSKGQDVLSPQVVKQTQTRKVDTTTKIDFGTEFPSGRYKFSPDSAESIRSKMTRIADFLVRHQKQNILIKIEGSESRVPNYDAETGKPLPDRALAKLRVEETKVLIQGMLQEMGKDNYNVGFDTTVRIGGPKFEKGDSASDHKFTEHQYVTVTLDAKGFVETERELRLCGYKKELGGGFGNPDEGFKVADTTQTLDMGTGSGKMGFKFDPYSVPDIFLVEYNGQLRMTGLLGQDRLYFRMAYATIIGNYYKDKDKPEWFKKLRYRQIQVDEALKIAAKDGAANVSDFAHVFGNHASFKKLFADGTIVPMMLEPGQIQAYDDNAPTWAESNWGIVIDKVEGVDEVKITPVGVIGQTKWRLHIDCIGCK
jgi:hypothetical protein